MPEPSRILRARRWAVTIAATAASTYALDAIATAAGIALAASGVLGGLDHLLVLGLLVASYVVWGVGLRVSLQANWSLLEETGTSTNVLSKAAFDLATLRTASPRARRLATSAGYVGTELAKEAPYYAGAFGTAVLTDSVVVERGAHLPGGREPRRRGLRVRTGTPDAGLPPPACPARARRGRLACAHMPLQNRVTPLGELVADPGRGLVYGNRGCLHDETGRIRRRYNGKRWIACRLRFKDWLGVRCSSRVGSPSSSSSTRRQPWPQDTAPARSAGGRTTIGSRPSGATSTLARPERTRWMRSFTSSGSIRSAGGTERIAPRSTISPTAPSSSSTACPGSCSARSCSRWSPGGYVRAAPRPAGVEAVLITPPSLVAVLAAGWRPSVPLLHPSARS